MASCIKCKAEESDSYAHAKCDNCDTILCYKCSSLTGSEHKAVALKKRSPCITFNCRECIELKIVESGTRDFVSELRKSLLDALKTGFDEVRNNLVKGENTSNKILRAVESSHRSNKLTSTLVSDLNDKHIVKLQDKMDAIKEESSKLTSTLSNGLEQLPHLIKEHSDSVMLNLATLKQDMKDGNVDLVKYFNSAKPATALPNSQVNDVLTDCISHNIQLDSQKNATMQYKVPDKETHGRITTQQVSVAIEEAKQLNIVNRLTNLSKTTNPDSKHVRKIVGSNREAGQIVAKEMKWLFTSKYSTTYTSENLLEYLKAKFPSRNFVVNAVKNWGTYNSFKVAVEAEMLNDALNPAVWPEGIVTSEFTFKNKGLDLESHSFRKQSTGSNNANINNQIKNTRFFRGNFRSQNQNHVQQQNGLLTRNYQQQRYQPRPRNGYEPPRNGYEPSSFGRSQNHY